MQKRIEAMIAAVQTVQPPLERFYGLLNEREIEMALKKRRPPLEVDRKLLIIHQNNERLYWKLARWDLSSSSMC